MKKIPLILALLPLLWCVPKAHAAEESNALAAADANGGYSGQVLTQISRHWTPPPDTINRRVAVRLKIDGEGDLAHCEFMTRSDMPEMNKAACFAAKEAGNFGVPPYGMPIEIYVTFWTGKPTKNTQGGKPVEDSSKPAAPRPEPKGVPVLPEATSVAPKQEPKGVPVLPEATSVAPKQEPKGVPVLPAKVESPKAPAKADVQTKPEPQAKPAAKPATRRGGLAGDNDAATTPIRSSTSTAAPTPAKAAAPKVETPRKESPRKEPAKKESAKKEATQDAGKKGTAQAEKPGVRTDFAPYRDPRAKPEAEKPALPSADQRRYAAELTAWVQARLVPPDKLPPGKYTMSITVGVGGAGDISEAALARSSGQSVLDESVLRAVLRMERVTPPPDKQARDVKLTLTVRKP